LNRKSFLLLALLFPFFSAVIATAQQQPQGELPQLTETIDVRVINIDVVVTDRKGNPVQGLNKKDFIILENGRPKEVSNFYEIRSAQIAAAPATQAPAAKPEETPLHLRRRIVFFIDNLSLAPFNRNRVFKSMKTFAEETLRPGDEAMIATWNRSMKVRLPFTSDARQIQQTLDTIAGESALGLQYMSERRSAESRIRDTTRYEDAIMTARSYAQSIEHDLRQTVSAINGLMSTLAGLDGKKIMVITSEGFPIQPGREMFHFIDDIRREKSEWQGYGSSLLESMGFNSVSLIQSVARAANANSITLYTLHAGGLAAMNEGSAEHSQPVSYGVSQAALTNSTESLQLMAEMTGGAATVGTNNFGAGFNRIKSDLESYYSLGYRAGTERVDRQRNVEVRINNRNYIVRARRSFVEKSIPTEMTDRVIANLFYPTTANDLNIVIKTGQPIAVERDRFRVPLEVRVPMDNLTLLQQGEIMAGGFSLYLVVANALGDMSDVAQQSQPLRIPPAEVENAKGKYYTYSVDLLMEKGRNRISVGVIDDLSNVTGFERQDVLAADLR
jgi:VWFA-related protein